MLQVCWKFRSKTCVTGGIPIGFDNHRPVSNLQERSLCRIVALRCQVLKPRIALDEGRPDGVGGTDALLGNDDFGPAFEVGIVLLVHLFAGDEGDHVGELRPAIVVIAIRATGNPTATQSSQRHAVSTAGQIPREHRQFSSALACA